MQLQVRFSQSLQSLAVKFHAITTPNIHPHGHLTRIQGFTLTLILTRNLTLTLRSNLICSIMPTSS